MLRQGTRIQGIEQWDFPIGSFEKYQEETITKATEKLEKMPKYERKPQKKKKTKTSLQSDEFNISELDNLKIQYEINEFLKDEDILKNIDVNPMVNI